MYLLLFGAFTGLGVRAFGNPIHGDSDVVCAASVECPDSDMDHSHGGEDEPHSDDEHEPECPDDPHEHHHHHGPCCVGNILMVHDGEGMRLSIPTESRLELSFVGSILPDGPVLSEDKPPLI